MRTERVSSAARIVYIGAILVLMSKLTARSRNSSEDKDQGHCNAPARGWNHGRTTWGTSRGREIVKRAHEVCCRGTYVASMPSCTWWDSGRCKVHGGRVPRSDCTSCAIIADCQVHRGSVPGLEAHSAAAAIQRRCEVEMKGADGLRAHPGSWARAPMEVCRNVGMPSSPTFLFGQLADRHPIQRLRGAVNSTPH